MLGLRVRLLGGFDCRTDAGEAVVFPTRKVRALFAYLLVAAGEVHSRDRLAGLLWGDHSEQQARTNLRTTLSRLRAALPERDRGMLTAESAGLSIAPGAVHVDVAAFLERVEAATPESLEQAASLYGGIFLDNLESCDPGFDEWLLGERRG